MTKRIPVNFSTNGAYYSPDMTTGTISVSREAMRERRRRPGLLRRLISKEYNSTLCDATEGLVYNSTCCADLGINSFSHSFTYTLIRSLICVLLGAKIEKRIDAQFNKTCENIKSLKDSLDKHKWIDIEYSIRSILSRLLNETDNDTQLFHVTPEKRQAREIFVSLGGVREIMRLFSKPFLTTEDARKEKSDFFRRKAELWNEILIILREICYAIPTLADNIFTREHITFLFTLLSHGAIFENAMNLLEEILAVRVDVYSLAGIPDFYRLVDKFSVRQSAHFCRVLSLVLFEPEDRQIMEGQHVLRSVDLLQLRRDRMAKANNIVERNQSLIIKMPGMLQKLVRMLTYVNYGPSLGDITRNNIIGQLNMNQGDVFQFLSPTRDAALEWEHYHQLDQIYKASLASPSEAEVDEPVEDEDSNSTGLNSLITELQNISGASDIDYLNSVIGGAGSADTNGTPNVDINGFISLMHLVQELGMPSRGMRGNNTARSNSPRSGITPVNAKKELQFHAILLSPHQVELLFVLSTLLSGRRKVDVQQQFAELGLATCLFEMYERMSWDATLTAEHTHIEHIHGPGCECNPESAIRTQYLRLVHNFYDRDFLQNANKLLVLSPIELEIVRNTVYSSDITKTGLFIPLQDRGLLSKIMSTLLGQPSDSLYRFWLSSCLEAYLRGSDVKEQLFIARSGILAHTTSHIIEIGKKSNHNLQTAFDLLGEIVKGNRFSLEMVEASLGDHQFRQFVDVVMNNLIDSNVFVRSLYLSMEIISEQYSKELMTHDAAQRLYRNNLVIENIDNAAYLTHTWVQFAPSILSRDAVALYANHPTVKGEACSVQPSKETASNTANLCGNYVQEAIHGLKNMFLSASTAASVATDNDTASGDDDDDKYSTPPQSPRPSPATASSVDNDATASPAPQWWVLPDSLFRFSMFLSKEREIILLRLMCAVTIGTINHENICCLNTALVMLILAERNGELASVLAKVRKLADADVDGGGDGDEYDAHYRSQKVMRNFRELLWYWQEYYLRRGRDRLSIEFSSHIPFKHWIRIVQILCRDDDSSTSLVSEPITTFRSPYSRKSCSRTVNSIINFNQA